MASNYVRYPATQSGTFPGPVTATSFVASSDGTALLPAYSFSSDLTTGMFLPAVGSLGFAAAGALIFSLNATSAALQVDAMTFGTGLAASNPKITVRSLTDGQLTLSGDAATTTGGVLRLYGSTHATKPSYIEFDTAGTNRFTMIGSSGNTTFTGTLTASNLSGTNTGNVTIGTASGLSIVGQALSLQVADSGSSGAVSATTQNFGGVKTFTSGGVILGVGTNSDAASGFIGEYIESVISAATNLPGSSGNYGDGTSISLTAGDWDVSLIVAFSLNGATVSGDWEAGIGTAAGASGTGLTYGNTLAAGVAPATGILSTLVVPSVRKSLAGTTTIYAKVLGTFSIGTPQFRCRISARRVR